MKTAVANFLISYFIMKLCGLEKYKTFYILEIILEAHFYNGVISFLENESTSKWWVWFIWANRSRNPWGSFRCSISSPCISGWCSLGNGPWAPLHHVEESAPKCERAFAGALPAGWKAPKILRRKGCDFFFSYTSLLSSMFLERLERALSGKRTLSQVIVLSVDVEYLYSAASAGFPVLPETQLTSLYGAKFYE